MSNRMKLKAPLRQPDKQFPIKAFDVQDWLKDGGRFVTRRELFDFVSRMEVGRRMRNRWPSRLRRVGRRLWAWLIHRPIEIEDKLYR